MDADKNRHSEMGVISYRIKETGEVFLGIYKDTQADFNSTNAKGSLGEEPGRSSHILAHCQCLLGLCHNWIVISKDTCDLKGTCNFA